MLQLCLLSIFLYSALALDCTQIPDSEIFAGNTVNLPGNYSTLQTIPANFNCIYRITVPVNSTSGLYANVTLYNGLKGVNDQITVIEQTGYKRIINYRSGSDPSNYIVIPGASMTIQVITKSVFMNSRFLVTVSYCNANIGKTSPLKTGGEMNYYEMSTTRDGDNLFSSVTFTSDEPIHVTVANYENNCWFCFVIDGTFDEQNEIYRLGDYVNQPFAMKSNAITVVSLEDVPSGFVLNPVSETNKFNQVYAMVTSPVVPNELEMNTFLFNFEMAAEVVNFDSTGIILTKLVIYSATCEAYIVSGPPNNSSKVLLDLSTRPKLPYSFDLKYFTVINNNCDLDFGVTSFNG